MIAGIRRSEDRLGMGVFLVLVAFGVFAPGSTWAVFVAFGYVGLVSVGEVLLSVRDPKEPCIDIGLTGWHLTRQLQIAVIILGAGSIVALYGLGGEYRDSVFLVVVGVIAADTCALLGGKLSRRLLPQGWWVTRVSLARPVEMVSRNKTVAGFVTGYALGAVVVAAAGQLWSGEVPPLWLVLVIPVAAEAGDLLASFTKRVIGAKHYTLFSDLPVLGYGHGGMLDRFDGHLFAAMVVGVGHLVGVAV